MKKKTIIEIIQAFDFYFFFSEILISLKQYNNMIKL